MIIFYFLFFIWYIFLYDFFANNITITNLMINFKKKKKNSKYTTKESVSSFDHLNFDKAAGDIPRSLC
jgi:hypothetical protein